jgi:hypothetical protein
MIDKIIKAVIAVIGASMGAVTGVLLNNSCQEQGVQKSYFEFFAY